MLPPEAEKSPGAQESSGAGSSTALPVRGRYQASGFGMLCGKFDFVPVKDYFEVEEKAPQDDRTNGAGFTSIGCEISLAHVDDVT